MQEPITISLWEQGNVPYAKGDAPEDTPTLTIYSPPDDINNGACIVVCPGGGYGALADHEGAPIAHWLNHHGATAAVLKYRLGPRYQHPVMLTDVQRALRVVRASAADLAVDVDRVGVLGFSAGGHLASTAATHFYGGIPNAPDPRDRFSCRPDVALLIYPVISLQDELTHGGSRENLLGKTPDPSLVDYLSNESQVTPETPPVYLVHSCDDDPVKISHSLRFALALAAEGVPFGMTVFSHGGHGYGLGGDDPFLSTWPDQCANWLKQRRFFG